MDEKEINERLDDLQLDGLKIIQNPDLFCFGIDAVLLSHFAKANPRDKVMDLCTGNGIIPLLMSALYKPAHIDGIEINPDSASLAKRSVSLNKLDDIISICEGDLLDAVQLFGREQFNVVTVNPPYIKEQTGLTNPDSALAIARHEIKCTLEDVIRTSSSLLKLKGKLFMVHKAFRLVDIITLMTTYHIEPKRMRFVHSNKKSAPSMVLVEGAKGGGRELKIEPPLFVYDEDGNYTEEIYEIYGMM